ncbi:acyl-CoA dehydrogenase family protein [Amycolatopsis sp. NPDC088138]|uniref:acyl-CoA dehydrogenase family protein n=1 Tax=Amycolatopsis sp. NPDC088138 TaxID=3363938 RepID=UPI00381CCDBB
MSPAVPTILDCLRSGRLRQDVFSAFPVESAQEHRDGDAIAADVLAHVRSHVDPDELDRTRELPVGLLTGLRDRGYLKLANGSDLGGRALSRYQTFRAVESAASWSVPVGQVLGIANGVGVAALLPAVPAGPLLDYLRDRVRDGVFSGFGQTEPDGHNNRRPGLTATPVDDGSAYVLSGEKLFIGHGTIADLLGVSATITDDGPPRVCVCFVDASDPGFSVSSSVEFMGSHGLPNASLRFDGVRVPAEHVLVHEDGSRMPPLIAMSALVGRLYFTAAPALALTKSCAGWSREFVARRRIDGLALGAYDEIQRMVTATAAEAYAMESVARWSLEGDELTDRWFDRFLAKNICVTAAWRAVDRTMSLLGGEGFETVVSKRRRGAPEIPMERIFRDARGLRIAGNIDFQLDNQAARLLLTELYTELDPATLDTHIRLSSPEASDISDRETGSAGSGGHKDKLARELRRFHRFCYDLVRGHPEPDRLLAREHLLILLARLAAELFTVFVSLARTATLSGDERDLGRRLTDVYCAEAWHRVADLWHRVTAGDEPGYAELSRLLMSGEDSGAGTGGEESQ